MRPSSQLRPRPILALLLAFIALGMALAITKIAATTGDPIADRELGQGNFVHVSPVSFVRARSLNLQGDPRANGIAIDTAGGHIYVADINSNRVLGWSSVGSFVNGQNTDIVIAAPDFLTAPGCQDFPNGICGPFGLAVDPSTGNLLIADDRSLDIVDTPFSQPPPSVALSSNIFGCCPLDDFGVAADSHGNIYVANRNNHDVVEFDAGSKTAHLVFGQATASGGGCNKGLAAPTLDTICAPYSVAVDPSTDDVYVADSGNNRVLVYFNPLAPGGGTPGVSGSAGDTSADLVIGQADFVHNGPTTTATGLSSPRGLATDLQHNLFVADTSNNRVTEYDAAITDGKAASLVVGQADAVSGGCNRNGAVGANTLCNPVGVALDGSGNLYVVDADNERVVAYAEASPPRTGAGTRVLGQHDLTHATVNFVDQTTVNPVAVTIDRASSPNHLYVADAINNRVLGYSSAKTFSNGGPANLVLGQPDFFSNLPNAGGIVGAKTLVLNSFSREGIAVDSAGNVWVSDPGNRRAVGYPTPFLSGMASNEAATKVLGEPNLTTALGGIGCPPAQNKTCAPQGLAIDSADNLYLIDNENTRILEFNQPWNFVASVGTPQELASLVFGQGSTGVNFSGTGCNQGGVSANTVCNPSGLAVDTHDNLYVADRDNNRVLVYDKPVPFASPTAPGHPGDVTADLVFGQGGDFTGTTCNPGGPGPTTLCKPEAVSIDPAGAVFIADGSNNRVLAFPEAASPPANTIPGFEFGQGSLGNDFVSILRNGGGISANSLDLQGTGAQSGVANDTSADLYVADDGNVRLLEYDGPFPEMIPPTRTATRTPTAAATKTATRTATKTATRTATKTATRTATKTATRTATPTATPTKTATRTASRTATPTATKTATKTATRTATKTASKTATRTATRTATKTATRTATPTATPTKTATRTASRTATRTATKTATRTATRTATKTPTRTATATPTPLPLTNNSFELPVVPSGSFKTASLGDNTTIPGWTVIGATGNVAVVSGAFAQNGFTFPAEAGAQWLDVAGTSDTATGVQLTVTTVPSASYRLTFWVGNIVNGGLFGSSNTTINVLINGSQLASATNSNGGGTTTLNWKQFTVTFVATSSSTTIGFVNGAAGGDSAGGLDNVAIIKQ